MAQSLQLMEIVNKHIKREVNRLKEELEQLELHIDNSTDNLKEADDIRGGW